MKTCTCCGLSKPLTDFYVRSNRKCSYAECKQCTSIRNAQAVRLKKLWAIEYLGGVCVDCSEGSNTYHPAVFQFHHLDPNSKDMDWGHLQRFSKERIQAELDKCVLLCTNCHILRHVKAERWNDL